MAVAHRTIPADSEITRLRDEGRTHREIADEVYRRTGVRVARSTISSALSRAGEVLEHRTRYVDEVPWEVRPEHGGEYPRVYRMVSVW